MQRTGKHTKRLPIWPLWGVLCWGSLTGGGALAETSRPDALAVVRHIDALWRGETSHAEMTMTVKTQHYEREMSLEAWSKGQDYSLVVIRAPKKDEGIATLKVKDQIWNYLPKINRVTKVPTSMMSGSWMGSHFTNDDLVKESTFEADYEVSLSGEDGRFLLVFSPRANAAVVWGRVEMWVDGSSWIPESAVYYDEDQVPVRTLVFSDPARIGDRDIPMKMTLQPTDKPDESTVLNYHSLTLGVPVSEDWFSLQALKGRR